MTRLLILDTNLAVLLIVGGLRKSMIGQHKRTRNYDITDFEILDSLLSDIKIAFTPNILTETSNLIRYIDGPAKKELSALLALIISKYDELIVGSVKASECKHYGWLGLTDASILELLREDKEYHLLTDDLDLYNACSSEGLSVTNFTHIRAERADFSSKQS